MHRFKAWLSEGLILVPTLLLLGLILFTLAFRLGRLYDFAELLPADTQAFFAVNLEDYVASGSPVQNAYLQENHEWMGRDMAVAWIDGSVVQLFEVADRGAAELFFNGAVKDRAAMPTELDPAVSCFETSLCFRFQAGTVAYSMSPEALATLGENTPRLEDNANYQNIHGRVGNFQSGFAYVDLQTVKSRLPVPLLAQSLLEIFPAWGASVSMEPTGWYMESFTPVNKDLISGAYFHPSDKYEQNFLPWTQPFAWEWGTQDLAAQLTRMQEIFTELSPSGELIFSGSLENQLEGLFGEVDLADVLPLLDGETYFGWTAENDFLFIAELENEEDRGAAQTLLQAFIKTYTYKNTYMEAGEQKATLTPMTGIPEQNGDIEIIRLQAEDHLVAALTFTENAVLVAPTQEALLNALARKTGQHSGRALDDFSVLLPGSDEIWILNSAFLPETNILKTSLSTLMRFMSTRKLFDDGVFTRTSLLP